MNLFGTWLPYASFKQDYFVNKEEMPWEIRPKFFATLEENDLKEEDVDMVIVSSLLVGWFEVYYKLAYDMRIITGAQPIDE